MRRRPLILRAAAASLVLGLAACGGREPDPPAPLPRGASAFQIHAEPARVEHSVPPDMIRNGVGRKDPRDAIQAIDEPRFYRAADARTVRDERRVIVVTVGDDARAYPLYILDRHELVNDTVGGRPLLVSWCPLCGSSVVYERTVLGHVLTFGVSGYLYESDVLMYDHATESFWSQLHRGAVAGPLTGTPLEVVPSHVSSFGAFRQAYPQGRVLHEGQGILGPDAYRRSPYEGYDRSPRTWFPVKHESALLHAKAEVVGVVVGGTARAYALAGLRALRTPLRDRIGEAGLRITYGRRGDEVHVHDEEGREVAAVRLYWFAWYAFHPRTGLWRGRGTPIASDPPGGR